MGQDEQRKIQNSAQRKRIVFLGEHLLKFTTIAFLLQGHQVLSEGNVGCHYLNSLCLEGIEFCYDDLVFGKCLSKAGVEMDDIDRSPLTEEQSRFLATMLEEMQGAGLGWDHPFVQCRIQGTMFSIRRNTLLPPNLCANLAPDPEILGPQSPLAFVRFAPPNEDYADEVYYPPPKKLSLDDSRDYREPSPLTEKQRKAAENLELLSEFAHQPDILDEERKNIIRKTIAKQELANRMKDLRNRIELDKMLTEYERGELRPPIYTNNDIYPGGDFYDDDSGLQQSDINNNLGAYKRTKGIQLTSDQNERNLNDQQPKTFFREFAISEHIPLNHENIDNNYKSHPLDAVMSSKQLSKDSSSDVDFSDNIYPSKYDHKSDQPGIYTEGGGLVYFSNNNKDEEETANNEEKKARTLIANMLGFTRHERLDVKKPGPLVGPPQQNLDKHQIDNKTTTKAETKEVLPAHIKGDTVQKTKKVTSVKNHSGEDHGTFSVDNEYAHVIIKNPIDSWNEGLRIISALADILNMNFTHPRIDIHEVSFRVEPNPEKKTAADVAKSINEVRFKNNISRRFGFIVLRAGVGNKVKHESESVMSARVELADEGPDVTHIMAYMFAGAGTAAIIVIMVTLFLIRRHDRNRDKLGGLQQGTAGTDSCSKDYQELCRARMAGKGQTQDSTAAGGRITLLSKDNERPPSSRSSTSSWSEEPALTNMDISTGHMVLSYMEDHLRNKGRLQREWEALCRYEAEPSARDAALQEKCALLNRPNAPLPYDHSRVVLNHLANAEGLDYINASTITDHDPRAPAYVAAQGPLPTTLAHFWQMIWEQGAVVIVALCRLQENGEMSCARYWPEEGAEVYHIYEVHLVSEHIWCDDYLVRSFYLKNLRTSETRTVTQFHFLSWPQGGVPPQAKPLLEFRRKVNKSYRGRSCPIVVHASAGAGRTGAYILLDLVLGRMNKGAREIDIAATLEHLRDQRASLVGTRQQFEFVLMAVAEEVHAILKALPANQSEKRELDKEPIVKEEDDDKTDIKKQQEKPEKGEEAKEKLVQKKDEM